jgi:hypothetical protein
MIRTIYKYWLNKGPGTQVLQIPFGAEHLTVQTQDGTPVLWSLIDKSAPIRPVIIDVFETGQTIDNVNRVYVGTYQLNGGELVYHVFVRI